MTAQHSMLVFGGARSGKSRFAEGVIRATGLEKIYVATAMAGDAEMAARIRQHQKDRGPGWTTVEAPIDLPGAIMHQTAPDRAVIVDCLTLWLTNIMLSEEKDPTIAERATDDLVAALGEAHGPLVLVSNEIGLGLVPDTALGRTFRDAQGRLNARVADAVDKVVFLAAGRPLLLKPVPQQDLSL